MSNTQNGKSIALKKGKYENYYRFLPVGSSRPLRRSEQRSRSIKCPTTPCATRDTTSLVRSEDDNWYSYVLAPRSSLVKLGSEVVHPGGIEPPTSRV